MECYKLHRCNPNTVLPSRPTSKPPQLRPIRSNTDKEQLWEGVCSEFWCPFSVKSLDTPQSCFPCRSHRSNSTAQIPILGISCPVSFLKNTEKLEKAGNATNIALSGLLLSKGRHYNKVLKHKGFRFNIKRNAIIRRWCSTGTSHSGGGGNLHPLRFSRLQSSLIRFHSKQNP